VFEDANIMEAAKACAFSMFRNSGQICQAQSRLYVHEQIKDEFLKHYEEHWNSLVKHGDPLDASTTQGPLADRAQFDRVMSYIKIGKAEGKLAFGGERSGDKGCFVQPTCTSLVFDERWDRLTCWTKCSPTFPMTRKSFVRK
jgi:aldehyde dehydrogenase (NAD+)